MVLAVVAELVWFAAGWRGGIVPQNRGAHRLARLRTATHIVGLSMCHKPVIRPTGGASVRLTRRNYNVQNLGCWGGIREWRSSCGYRMAHRNRGVPLSESQTAHGS